MPGISPRWELRKSLAAAARLYSLGLFSSGSSFIDRTIRDNVASVSLSKAYQISSSDRSTSGPGASRLGDVKSVGSQKATLAHRKQRSAAKHRDDSPVLSQLRDHLPVRTGLVHPWVHGSIGRPRSPAEPHPPSLACPLVALAGENTTYRRSESSAIRLFGTRVSGPIAYQPGCRDWGWRSEGRHPL
jgi:hypothetical protein